MRVKMLKFFNDYPDEQSPPSSSKEDSLPALDVHSVNWLDESPQPSFLMVKKGETTKRAMLGCIGSPWKKAIWAVAGAQYHKTEHPKGCWIQLSVKLGQAIISQRGEKGILPGHCFLSLLNKTVE